MSGALVSLEDCLRGVPKNAPSEVASSSSAPPLRLVEGSLVVQHILLVSTMGRKGSSTRLLRTLAAIFSQEPQHTRA